VAGTPFQFPKSAANGHFRTTLTIAAGTPAPMAVCAVLRNGDERCFAGTVLPMADTAAPMVISDVDDTIKITNVRDRRAAITNTFCKPFEEVPGMAAAYQRWAGEEGAVFHYVSGSPWQLYTPLETFVREKKFPSGAWHLKHLRIADPETIIAFLGEQHEHKLNCIRPLLERWQKRRFILVGDTGEQDPEIYATLAREHPGRITRIFLRNVTKETRDNPRMATAFKEVPAEKWLLFDKAEELPANLKP
jgi:phosphatidate phosphatase APP1